MVQMAPSPPVLIVAGQAARREGPVDRPLRREAASVRENGGRHAPCGADPQTVWVPGARNDSALRLRARESATELSVKGKLSRVALHGQR